MQYVITDLFKFYLASKLCCTLM